MSLPLLSLLLGTFLALHTPALGGPEPVVLRVLTESLQTDSLSTRPLEIRLAFVAPEAGWFVMSGTSTSVGAAIREKPMAGVCIFQNRALLQGSQPGTGIFEGLPCSFLWLEAGQEHKFSILVPAVLEHTRFRSSSGADTVPVWDTYYIGIEQGFVPFEVLENQGDARELIRLSDRAFFTREEVVESQMIFRAAITLEDPVVTLRARVVPQKVLDGYHEEVNDYASPESD
jgi:hypothetical protein